MGPRQLIEAWVEAFNARDLERIVGFYREDATNYQVPEAPVTGQDAIRAMFKHGFALAEMVCIPENIFEDGEWAFSNGAIRQVSGDAVSSTLSMDRLFCSVATGTS